jgi:tRNA uridine 5-carboxymethylaminomethyl modification enzyme
VEQLNELEMDAVFDIIVIGGGHAGVEAAWIAQQFPLKVGIISIPHIGLASAPCNPAVGGVGKGQVVRELDALGGLMGRLADLAGIQYRVLNESKGDAVQSTRVQIDKDQYSINAEQIIQSESKCEILRGKVQAIEEAKDKKSFDITFLNNELEEKKVYAKKLIITTGTFLSGQLHCGESVVEGGRVDCPPSKGLNSLVANVPKLKKKFKTGTPARLRKNSLDYSQMIEQKSDASALNFHLLHEPFKRYSEQVSCYLSHTTEETLKIIRDNKERSPMYNGQITGIGPRYCPSIEDKAYRYPDRDVHHVFIEPEGLALDTIYPNGVSTSLPRDVQEAFLRTIPGLQNAEIAVYGYAVEYDVVDTAYLANTLEHKLIPGLFFAGQVNGTSGYEEAAGQGYIAGVNAALSLLGREALILPRNESYIGVMIDDLVSITRDEPYRLFTARSQNRLELREDNTVIRMAPYRLRLELDYTIDQFHETFLRDYEALYRSVRSEKLELVGYELYRESCFGQTGKWDESIRAQDPLIEVLKRPEIDPTTFLMNYLAAFGLEFDMRVVKTVAITAKYEGYISRAKVELGKLAKVTQKKIDWMKLSAEKNISFECRQRILEHQPTTFLQLQMIDGIRPATLSYVANVVL